MAPKIIDQVTLNFTDLTGSKTGCTTLGSNKFWKGWVEDLGGGTANFCCQWGATGTPGKTTGSKHGIALSTALSVFAKKKASKIKKGYTELEVRDDAEEAAKAAAAGVVIPAKGKAKAPKVVKGRTFDPQVSTLLSTIYGSTANTVRRGLSPQAGSTDDNPIGNLSDRQLDIGGGVLDEVESALEAEFGRETAGNKDTTLPLDREGVPNGRIIELTNQYMSNVPRSIDRADRGKRNLHRLVISSFERLAEQRRFLQLLRDAHVAKAVFAQAAVQTTTGGKESVWYDGLGCDIEALRPGSDDYKFVARVFNNQQSRHNANWWRGSKSRLRIVRVFKFSRQNTEAAFDAYSKRIKAKRGATGNIFAWHGTRTPNLLGIGKAGLLMPENLPRGIRTTGKAFGNGIYHAPAWNATNSKVVAGNKTDGTNGALKSMNYTGHQASYYGGSGTGNAFMFLQEVALGVADVRHSACFNQHRPSGWPQKDWTYANAGGCRTLTHDEVVTYDENAQMFRYLVEIAVD
jgi:predicted DNA-binding WGR domain protein